MHTYEGKRTKMMMLFQWNMTLRYIRNYLRYSLRWATSSSFRNEQCSQLFHLTTHTPPPPSLPVGTSVTRKINTKKKTRSKKKTCIKCKICANKLPQRATGYPRKPRGRGGAMLEKILPTVMKLPSINRQLYMLCITLRSMAFFSIWKLTTKTKTNKHKSYGRVYSTVTYPLVMWIKQFIMFNLYFVLHTLQRRPWKSVVPSNYFCSNFYVHFSIATIFSEAIWAFIVIVFTTNELSCIEITLEVRFFID